MSASSIARRFLLSIEDINENISGNDLTKIQYEWDKHHSSITDYITSFRCTLCSETKLNSSIYCSYHLKAKNDAYRKYKLIEEEIKKVLSENKTTMIIRDIRRGMFKEEDFIGWKLIGGFAILIDNVTKARREYQLTFHSNDKDINHENIITNYEKLSNLLKNIRVTDIIIPDMIPCPIMFQTIKKDKTQDESKKKPKKKKKKIQKKKESKNISNGISVTLDGEFTTSVCKKNIIVGSNLFIWNSYSGIFSSTSFKNTSREEVVKEIDPMTKRLLFKSGRSVFYKKYSTNKKTWFDEQNIRVVIGIPHGKKEYLLDKEILYQSFNISSRLLGTNLNSDISKTLDRWSIITDEGIHASMPIQPDLVSRLDWIGREWLYILKANEDLLTNDKSRKDAQNSYITNIFNQIVRGFDAKYSKDFKKLKDKNPILKTVENKSYKVDIGEVYDLSFRNGAIDLFDNTEYLIIVEDFIQKIELLITAIHLNYMKLNRGI